MYQGFFDFIALQKGKQLSVYDVAGESGITSFILVTHFNSPLENKRFADSFMKEYGQTDYPEGYSRGEWIIFDLGEVVIHSFTADKREKYNLDKLWQNRRVNLENKKSKK